jgi:hypothetical protein
MAVKTYAGNVSPYDGTEYILVRASGVITLLHIGQAANFTTQELDFLDDDFIFTDGGVISDTIIYEAIYSSSANPADGDMLYRAGSRFRNLNPGAPGEILQVSSLGDPEWASISELAGVQGPAGPDSRALFTAKGQLLSGTGVSNGTIAGGTITPAPASNGQVLVADNTLTGGIKWENPATVSGDVDPATNVSQGTVRLSAAAANAADPIAVGDNDTRMTNARTPTTHTHAQSEVTNLTADLAARQLLSQKGVANGYAGLGADGKVSPAQGGQSYPIRTVTSSTTVTSADRVIVVNNSTSATVTLPAASAMTTPVVVRRQTSSTANVVIAPNGAETISGDPQLVLADPDTAATLMPISGGWIVEALNGYIDTTGGFSSIPPSIFIAKGDIPVATSPGVVSRIGVGNNGEALVADSTTVSGVRWSVVGGGLQASLFDAKGDLLVGSGADTTQRLPVGLDGEVLVSDSAQTLGIKWSPAAQSGIQATIVDAKGDLIVGSGLDAVTRLPTGTNDQFLIVDSTQVSGLRWATKNASTSASGLTKLSAAPTSATDPVAVGANDIRMVGRVTSTVASDYTLSLTDAGTVVEVDSATAKTVIVPPDSSVNFPIGTTIGIRRYGVGDALVVAGTGVTLRSPNGFKGIANQYDTVELYKRSANEWILHGNLVDIAFTFPDLAINDISWSPASPTAGDSVIFSATVVNQGSVATPAGVVHGVSFSVNGQEHSWNLSDTASLAPGASRVITANSGSSGSAIWPAVSGAHQVIATVDQDDLIAETNEANNTFTETISVAEAVDTTAPAAPTGLGAIAGTQQVTLNWNDNVESDLSYYAVRYSTVNDPDNVGAWTRHTTNFTASAATVTGLTSGTTYYFYVTAVDTSSNVSPRSSVVSAVPTGSAPSGTRLFDANFESGVLTGIFKNSHVQGASGSHVISTEQARTGTRSLKLTLNNPNGTTSRYQQVINHTNIVPNTTDTFVGVSIYLHTNWNLAQTTNNGSFFTTALFGFRYTGTAANGPNNNLNMDTPGGVSTWETYTNLTGGTDDNSCNVGRADCVRMGAVAEGVWVDWVMRVKWSTSSTGIREIWKNGVKIHDYRGVTSLYSSNSEYRIGLYCGGGVDHTRTVYYDNYRIGTSYAAVDPSQAT